MGRSTYRRPARTSRARVRARRAARRPGARPAARSRSRPFPYAFGSPATAGLYRLHGAGLVVVRQGAPARPSLAGAGLHAAGHGEQLRRDVPVALRARAVGRRLRQPRSPTGMRTPVLHGLVDLGDDRVAVWMEDVTEAPPTCGPRPLRRAPPGCSAAGTRAAPTRRWSPPTATQPGFALRMYAETAVPVPRPDAAGRRRASGPTRGWPGTPSCASDPAAARHARSRRCSTGSTATCRPSPTATPARRTCWSRSTTRRRSW